MTALTPVRPVPALSGPPANTNQTARLNAAGARIVGVCPGCGGDLVSVPRHRGGIGAVAATECWAGMSDGFGCPGRGEG